MKPTFFLIFLCFCLSACTFKHKPSLPFRPQQPITYPELMGVKLLVTPLQDVRKLEADSILNGGSQKVQIRDDFIVCVNAEANYHHRFMDKLSDYAAYYIQQYSSIGKSAVRVRKPDYTLEWQLAQFRIIQSYDNRFQDSILGVSPNNSANQARSASPIATGRVLAPSIVDILIRNIILKDEAGQIVKRLDDVYTRVETDLYQDADCKDAYKALDGQFQCLITEFAQTVEEAIFEDLSR